jgi:hypothetical protein
LLAPYYRQVERKRQRGAVTAGAAPLVRALGYGPDRPSAYPSAARTSAKAGANPALSRNCDALDPRSGDEPGRLTRATDQPSKEGRFVRLVRSG